MSWWGVKEVKVEAAKVKLQLGCSTCKVLHINHQFGTILDQAPKWKHQLSLLVSTQLNLWRPANDKIWEEPGTCFIILADYQSDACLIEDVQVMNTHYEVALDTELLIGGVNLQPRLNLRTIWDPSGTEKLHHVLGKSFSVFDSRYFNFNLCTFGTCLKLTTCELIVNLYLRVAPVLIVKVPDLVACQCYIGWLSIEELFEPKVIPSPELLLGDMRERSHSNEVGNVVWWVDTNQEHVSQAAAFHKLWVIRLNLDLSSFNDLIAPKCLAEVGGQSTVVPNRSVNRNEEVRVCLLWLDHNLQIAEATTTLVVLIELILTCTLRSGGSRLGTTCGDVVLYL